MKFFANFQEVYKEAKTGRIPDDETVHANKDKNRVMECPTKVGSTAGVISGLSPGTEKAAEGL
jgi:hypothetical protein